MDRSRVNRRSFQTKRVHKKVKIKATLILKLVRGSFFTNYFFEEVKAKSQTPNPSFSFQILVYKAFTSLTLILFINF
jgi:hypothetical protein